MKICDIVQFYSSLSGGVKRYIDDKIRYFGSRPDIEHVVVVPSDRNAVSAIGQTRIYEMKSIQVMGSRSYRLLVSRRRIREVIEQEQPDIIEVGDPYHTAWISHGIARTMNIPIVSYYHSDYPRALGRTISKYGIPALGHLTEKWITRYLVRLYNRMDATVVATPVLEEVLRGIGIQRIIRVPLGTDTDRFHPVDQREQVLRDLGLPSDCRLLLYVGRMAREKNVLNLVRMMDCFANDGTTALLMVGDGEQGDQIQRMARQRGNVFWHPYCNSPELLSVFYSAADAFVHPGTHETFGLVSLEAQSCGAPVVAVENGGVDSTLAFEPRSALARCIGQPLSFMRAWAIAVSTEFGIAASPGGIGGAAIRLGLLKKSGISFVHGGTLMAADLFTDILFFLSIAPFAILVLINRLHAAPLDLAIGWNPLWLALPSCCGGFSPTISICSSAVPSLPPPSGS